VPTLRDRLPADLRDAPSGPDFDALPFTSLCLLGDESAAEIANRTMHGVLHIGLVERPRTATPPRVGPLGGVGAPPLKLGPDSISLLSKAEEEAGTAADDEGREEATQAEEAEETAETAIAIRISG
jgi:hypothetical protein